MAELLHVGVGVETFCHTFAALPRQSSTAGAAHGSAFDRKDLSSNGLGVYQFPFDRGMEDALSSASVTIPPRAKIAAPASAPAGVSGAPQQKCLIRLIGLAQFISILPVTTDARESKAKPIGPHRE